MGIEILPPDINEGEWNFSVSGNAIRYGLCAIKGIGREVVHEIVKERMANGAYVSLVDFVERLSSKETNKRTIENFIWAGALDCMPGTRREKIEIYGVVVDQVNKDRKESFAGQISLFDLGMEQFKKEITMPECGEYEKNVLLLKEKEVLGTYVSGHPMDQYRSLWEKNVTAVTRDFQYDEELKDTRVKDNDLVWVGGILDSYMVKTTKTGGRMAFLNMEDMLGSMEVIVFPREFEKYRSILEEDAKLFIKGRVSAEEEKAAKLIAQQLVLFEQVPKELWIQFADFSEYEEKKSSLFEAIQLSDGQDQVVIYLKKEQKMQYLPRKYSICCNEEILTRLYALFSKENVKVVEKTIEKRQ